MFTGMGAYPTNTVNSFKSSLGGGIGIIGGAAIVGGFEGSMRAAKAAGLRRHAYLEGPGGNTAGSGMAREVAAAQSRARSYGVNTSNWVGTGWANFTREQIKRMNNNRNIGPLYSMEIDNMDNANGVKYSGPGLVKFLIQYQKWQVADGHKTKIVLKNLTPGMIRSVAAALRSGQVKRDTIAEYAIAEETTPNKSCTTSLYASLGIRQLNTTNTKRYQGSASYGLNPQRKQVAASTKPPPINTMPRKPASVLPTPRPKTAVAPIQTQRARLASTSTLIEPETPLSSMTAIDLSEPKTILTE